MSSFYKRGRGRKTTHEKDILKEVNDIIDANDVDTSEMEIIDNFDDLQNFRDDLVRKYGKVREEEPEQVEEKPSAKKEQTEQFELEETEDKPTEQITTSNDEYSLSDFTEVKTQHAFSEGFKEEDLYKAENSFEQEPEPTNSGSEALSEPTEQAQPNDSVPDAFAEARKARKTRQRIESVNNDDEVSDEKSEESERKAKLSKTVSKKATKNVARQTAKIVTFLMEGGAKWYGKVPDKTLDKLEQQGKIDRHYVYDKNKNKTVAELVDEHNTFLDEVVKVDADTHDDLVEALMLVAEEHEIEVSPTNNLLLVILSMGISLFQASHTQKKEMQRTLKKMQDNYQLEIVRNGQLKQEVEQKDNKIAELEAQIKSLSFGSQNNNASESGVTQLSFGDSPKKPSISVVKGAERKRDFKEAESMLEEVTSTVQESSEAIEQAKANNKKNNNG
jgi:hypothetical protein